MRSRIFLSAGLLLCILLLSAGCTQPVPGAQGTTIPATGVPAAPVTTTVLGTPAPQPTSPGIPIVVTTAPLARGRLDPAFVVDIDIPEKIQPGTTLLIDNHDLSSPRIVEVNRLGEIVWEYPLPQEQKQYTNPGWDVELLPNGNILTLLPRYGVLEINRDKQVVWKYLDAKISHDADRLPDGNTLIAYGAYDTAADPQVKEVDASGKRVWSWYAKDIFFGGNYSSISDEGWTHTNAVSRLENGNTLVSLRNFDFIAEVNHDGKLVRKIGEGLLEAQHDPLVLPNGNILLANHARPNQILELDTTGAVIWRFPVPDRASMPVRDANRLANGNTLITEADRIVEVTPAKEVVWEFRLTTEPFTDKVSSSSRGFYKAERIAG